MRAQYEPGEEKEGPSSNMLQKGGGGSVPEGKGEMIIISTAVER